MNSGFAKFAFIVSCTTLTLIGVSTWKKSSEAQSSSAKKPNVVMIIADDMGFSDIAPFGGENQVPNISALAKSGMKLTNFHGAPSCSPSRAMMLSGMDNHQAGLGNMAEFLSPNQKGKPGYEGYINDRVLTLPQALKDAGYNTYMAGKWHLGFEPTQHPVAKGFTESFALLGGAGGHKSDLGYLPEAPKGTYVNNDKVVNLPATKDFYDGNFYTDRLIENIDRNRKDGKPFFIYAAYTQPHDPLQAPQQSIQKHISKYTVGWDKIREQRFERIKQMGLLPLAKDAQLPPRVPGVPAWEKLTPYQQRYNAKKMATYAAMIEILDGNVGRLVAHLKKIGEYDNTIIVFLSDNGPAAHAFGEEKEYQEWFEKDGIENNYDNIGNANSFVSYGKGWTQVSSTPLLHYKGRVSEGGIRVPAILSGGAIKQNGKSDAFTHVSDLMPTILDYAGVKHPGTSYKGRTILPLGGRSMRPVLEGKANRIYSPDEPLGYELYGGGNSALYLGDWKIMNLRKPYGDTKWQLYNLAQDPMELKDLSQQYPEQKEKMISMYKEYEKTVGIVPASADDPNAASDAGL